MYISYHIRTAEERDVTAIYNFICILEEKKFDSRIFENMFTKNISNKNYHYLVGELPDGNIAGFISCHVQDLLHHCGKVAEIQELFVEEKYRKHGLGKQLIDYLETMLLQDNCVSFEVTARSKRLATHGFYKSVGFECTHNKFVKQLSPL